jgi:hypothetical protein
VLAIVERRDRRDLLAGEFAGKVAQGALFFGECKVNHDRPLA